MQITLPWFDKVLNPNVNSHWTKKAQAKKLARSNAAILATPYKTEFEHANEKTRFELKVTFYPPNARCHDLDNCFSSLKAGIDGICDALGINDRHILVVTLIKGSPDPLKQGKVLFCLTPLPNGWFAS